MPGSLFQFKQVRLFVIFLLCHCMLMAAADVAVQLHLVEVQHGFVLT